MLNALLAGVAVWLVVPSAPGVGLRRLQSMSKTPRHRALRATPPVLVGLAAAGVVLVGGGPAVLGWAITAGVAGATVCWLVLRRVAARQARERAFEVAESARLLSSLLATGQIPTEALRETAKDFPVLAPAAAAAKLGGDVPAALRSSAGTEGSEGLRTVAAAWQVSSRSGAPVAGVLQGVAEALRQERRVAEIVETELATARTSGQIMAALPFAAVALGFFAGTNSLEFLFGAGLGQWLCAVAVLLTAVGLVWIERLAKR